MVWEDFTRKEVGDGETRAFCMICKQNFAYRKGSKNLGTSHLKRHLEHHKGPSKISVQAAGPIKDTPRRCKKYTPQRGSRTASVPVAFDSERCRHEIARMIILHDYPLHMVEHKGFMTFFHNLQPKFNMVDFNTAQGDCVATYLSERSTIKNLIAQMPGRICLTLDLWNSNNTTGYVFITGQFIDSEWNIHKRLLSVVMELYPESEFAFSHAVCTCLIDRNIQGRLFSVKLNQTQPFSEIASELKEEFSRLDTLYPDYFKSPSGEDWNLVDNLCTYLKLIFDTASMMASLNVPTANTFFDEAWKIQLELTHASTSEDNIISTITKPMLEGFDKYWKSSCFGLAIAVVMDPRQQSKSELDQYLEESLLPRSHEFDVMRWWKLNEPKYPTLSKMARDILTLPVSTVDPESIFDTGVKEMDRYRCALKPETVEALYCAKDWLRTESIESMDSLVKMEFQI
ncbi:zinc finger BED domain-containing protein DAYSLEEPER-like protein [Tanacetum coccineum]